MDNFEIFVRDNLKARNREWLAYGVGRQDLVKILFWDVYLLDQLNTSLEVHTEVNELPINTLSLVLFLLQDKHVVVEELLQFLIGEVNTQLLKSVILL